MFKRIMVPLDGSELAECVIPYIEGFIDEGQVESLFFVRVIKPVIAPASLDDNITYFPDDWRKWEFEKKTFAEDYLKKVVGRLKQNGVKFQIEVLVGRIGDTLLDYIKNNEFDLIVIANHGRSGLSRWVRGSVADKILSASQIPVLMIQTPGSFED